MTQELQYTSAPHGLKAGSQGFCTVVCTPGMSASLAQRVEDLSAYRHVFAANDPNAWRNPVAHSHLRVSAGNKTWSVLSRIGFAGLDYSQRANKFAHHVVLEPDELPAGGPAWLLAQPGFMLEAWDGQVRVIPAGRQAPRGDCPPGVCRSWASLCGDAGWAGVMAEAFLADPKRLVYLVFEPGMAMLPLLVEAQALLPPARRWAVTFSTYFTSLPQGTPCVWRCVLRDSPEARQALHLPQALILDLHEPLPRAEGGALVEQARTGRLPARRTAGTTTRAAEISDARRSPGSRTTGSAEGPALPPTAPAPRAPGRLTRRQSRLALSILVGSVGLCAVAGLLFFLTRPAHDASGASHLSPQAAAISATAANHAAAGTGAAAAATDWAHLPPKPGADEPATAKPPAVLDGQGSHAMIIKPPAPTEELSFAEGGDPAPEPELVDLEVTPDLIKNGLPLPGVHNAKLRLVGIGEAEVARWSVRTRQTGDGALVATWDPKDDLSVPVTLVSFKVADETLLIDWKRTASQSTEVRAAQALVRDCILEVEPDRGPVKRFLLRKRLTAPAIVIKGKEATLSWAAGGGKPERPVFFDSPRLRLGDSVYRGDFLGDPTGKDNEVFAFDLRNYGIKLELTFHRSDARGRPEADPARAESKITLAFTPNEKEVALALQGTEKQMTRLRQELDTLRQDRNTATSVGADLASIRTLDTRIGEDNKQMFDLEAQKRRLTRQREGIDQVTQGGEIDASVSIKLDGKRVTVATLGKPQ